MEKPKRPKDKYIYEENSNSSMQAFPGSKSQGFWEYFAKHIVDAL